MIMDIVHQVRGELKMSALLDNNNSNNTKIRDLSVRNSPPTATTMSPSATTPAVTATKKRAFDVAFLMQPDEKLQAAKSPSMDYGASARKIFHPEGNISIKADALLRQMGSPYSSVVDDTSSVGRTSRSDSPTNEEIDIMTNGNSNSSLGSANPIDTVAIQESVRYFRNHVNNARNNNNNSHMMSPRIYATHSPSLSDLEVHRSAFTKVPQVRLDSPAPPLSPDRHSCPSISPPTVSTTPPRQFANFRSSDYGFPQHFSPFLQQQPQQHQPPTNPYGAAGHLVTHGDNGKLPSSASKPQYFYRPVGGNHNQIRALEDLQPNGYLPQFQMMGASAAGAPPQMHPFHNDLSGIVRHPAAAAAILSTLIPPTIASSFSLAAQNICAKCNISFRMTSDLVYHMRSHHKSENMTDTHRRKREEKLKCPVCNESFRERHHLTRHMTAHQDKESDDAEPPQSAAAAARNHQLMANPDFMSSVAKARQHHHHANGLLQMNQQQQHNKSH